MPQRQKILLAGFIAIVVVWQGAGTVWSMIFGPIDSRLAEIERLDTELQLQKKHQLHLQLSERRLAQWKQRSLPPDPRVAATVYHRWLLELAEKTKLKNVVITPSRVSNVQTVGRTAPTFQRVSLVLKAECQMETLCKFLFDFYSTDLLQRIVRMSIDSSEATGDPTLKVDLTVEGLALVGIPSRQTLIKEGREKSVSDAMKDKTIETYAQLYKKNRFVRGYNGPVAPPRPPAPRIETPPFDSAPHVMLISSIVTSGVPEAWLYDRTLNQRTVLYNGDEFDVAGVKGKVLDIGKRFVTMQVNDKQWRLELGDNLKQLHPVDGAIPPRSGPTAVPGGATGTAPSATPATPAEAGAPAAAAAAAASPMPPPLNAPTPVIISDESAEFAPAEIDLSTVDAPEDE